MEEIFKLKSKKVVVTGGASGLGLSIAEGFGEAGAELFIIDNNQDNLDKAQSYLQNKGLLAKYFAIDITKEEDIQKIAEQIKDIDVLVNSAGINIRKSVSKLSVKEYKTVLDVNLVGTFICSKVFGSSMAKKGGGSIINIASIHSHSTMEKQSAYAASKGGVLQLTKVLALEYAESNVRVNALSPGFHRTPFAEGLFKDQDQYNFLLKQIPLKRIAEAKEIIGPALFLASEASSYVTGISLISDGGYLAQ